MPILLYSCTNIYVTYIQPYCLSYICNNQYMYSVGEVPLPCLWFIVFIEKHQGSGDWNVHAKIGEVSSPLVCRSSRKKHQGCAGDFRGGSSPLWFIVHREASRHTRGRRVPGDEAFTRDCYSERIS